MIDDYSAEARCKSDSGVGPESMECLGVNPKLLTFVAANLPCYARRMALEAGQWLNGSNAHKRAERLFTSISQLRLISLARGVRIIFSGGEDYVDVVETPEALLKLLVEG